VAYASTVETRYMRNDETLQTTNTASLDVAGNLSTSRTRIGAKVYVDSTCISGTNCIALVAPPGPPNPPAEKDGTWNCPVQASAGIIKVEVYACSTTGTLGNLIQTFVTSDSVKLDAATWTVHYWCQRSLIEEDYFTDLYYGDATYISRITNFTWTAGVSKAWHDVSIWTTSLVTRLWSSGTSWSFNLPTMQWNTVKTLTFSLIVRTWQTINSWIFNLATLGWHDTANWMFELRTRVWNIIGILGDEAIAANYTDRDSGYALWKLFQQGGGCSAQGETFQVPSDGNYKLTKATFCLRRTGSPTGYAHVALYVMNGTFGVDGKPIGSALATSDDFDVSTLTTSYTWYNFTFSSAQQYVMQAEEFYCIVYQNPSSGFFNSTNFVLAGMNTDPTYEGNRIGYVNEWVGDNAFDSSFYVYGSPITSMMSLYLGTSIWTDIATWGASLVAMMWNDVATYTFNLLSMAWHDLTWLFSLLPPLPAWNDITRWLFSLPTSTGSGLLLICIVIGIILSLGFVRVLASKKRKTTQTTAEMLYRLSYRIRKKGSFQRWFCL
jgi:hypothetical protein